MSYFIIGCFCPNYEDNDRYGIERNAYSGFPDLWPEERYAERKLYEEWKAMRDGTSMWLRYNRTVGAYEDEDEERDPNELPVIVRALVSIAKENGWKMKNTQLVEWYKVSPVYTIPPMDEDEPMPRRWNDIVRWMDRQKKKEEQAAKDEEERKAEREEQRRRASKWNINADALLKFMGDMLPFPIITIGEKTVCTRRAKSRAELQTMICAELASKNGWKRNDPCGYRGIAPRIYKTA